MVPIVSRLYRPLFAGCNYQVSSQQNQSPVSLPELHRLPDRSFLWCKRERAAGRAGDLRTGDLRTGDLQTPALPARHDRHLRVLSATLNLQVNTRLGSKTSVRQTHNNGCCYALFS